MIHLTAAQGKYYFSDVVILLSGQSMNIDEEGLTLGQLEGLKDGYQTGRLLMSSVDYTKLLAAIKGKQSSGGGGKVGSVNGEIGEVILDASEIDFTSGGSIEEKFGDLSPVAFSGSYLDLSNRPGGTGEPFVVVPWNPYRQELTELPFIAGNDSTAYTSGHISKKVVDSVELHQIDIGYPNSPEIVVTNGVDGGLTNLAFTPDTDKQFSKTLAIKEISSVAVKPLDVFPNDANITKGVTISFFVFQLEAGEDVTTMGVQDIIGKPRNISINFMNLYTNEYNGYTQVSYNINNNGGNSISNQYYVYGDYDFTSFKVVDNKLTMGGNFSPIDLSGSGFEANKKFAAIFICQLSSSTFDVSNTFNLSLGGISLTPSIKNQVPDLANIKVNKDANIMIAIEGDPNESNPEYFGMSFMDTLGDLNIYTPNGQSAISSNYIDSNGDIYLNIEGNDFKLKDITANQYVTVYTKTTPLLETKIGPNQVGEQTDWYFEVTDWKKTIVLDGLLPGNVSDGSVLKITNNGRFNNIDLLVNDYIQLYDNKTKFILNRQVDVTPLIDSKLGTLAGEGLKFENQKLALKLSSNSGLEYINDNELQVITTFQNKYINYPTLFNRMYEEATYFNQSSQIQIDLTNGTNIYVCRVYPYGQTAFSVNLATNAFGMSLAMGKTVTILLKDFTSNSYVTWPSEFMWSDGAVPDIEVGKSILITGIVVGTQFESYTSYKLLCTYSVF